MADVEAPAPPVEIDPDDAAPVDDAPVVAGRSRTARWGLGPLVGTAWFAVAVVANLDLLRKARLVEDGDFAANSILIDKALSGRLLVGNYSRVGFHHPGPAILTAQAAGQAVFERFLGVVSSPFQGHFLGILVLNAVCIGIATAILARRSGSVLAALALQAVFGVVNLWEPFALASTWMPHTYIAPFLLLCVAAAAVLTGSWHDLRYLVLGGALLVHGHVSFVMFVGLTTAAVIGWAAWAGSRRPRRDGTARGGLRARDPVAAGAVLGVFALPMVVNLVLHWPGELEDYLDYSSDRSGFQPRDAGDVVRFVGHYWTQGGPWSIALVVAAGVVAVAAALGPWLEPAHRRLVRGVLSVVAFEVGLLVVYVVRGVDDLSQPYIGLFALTGPALVLWAGCGTMVALIARRVVAPAGPVLASAVLVVVFVSGLAVSSDSNPYRGMTNTRDMLAAVGREPVRLDFATPGWPSALGLMEQMRRRDQPVCVLNPVWEFLVTNPTLCRPSSQGPVVVVIGPGEPVPDDTGTVVYEEGGTALVVRS